MGTSASLLLVLFAAIFLIVFLIMKVRLNAFVTLIIACFCWDYYGHASRANW